MSSQISEKFRLLHSAFPGLKITTNFDCLIEDSATTHVVGRDKELQEIRKRLEVDRGTVQMISGRLFSLEGIGGVGKTTLAIEVARKYSSLFSDGVLPLIRVDEETPSTLAMKIAKYFNIKLEEPPDSQTAQHQITFILKNRNALLILDNAVDWQSLRYMLPNHCSHMT